MLSYTFLDEWDVAAPIESVFAALSDPRTYTEWWAAVYLRVEADGPPRVDGTSTHIFHGRLPYQLRTVSTMVRMEPPREFEFTVAGDLAGRGIWTLTPTPSGTHVRFDWRVDARRGFIRVLTPVLRPLFRWNHSWAIARAKEGLEPYAQRPVR